MMNEKELNQKTGQWFFTGLTKVSLFIWFFTYGEPDLLAAIINFLNRQ